MPTKKIATYTLLIALVVFKLMDTIITLMIKYKHKAFNELNPIYLKTGSVWLMCLYSFVALGMLIFVFLMIYKRAGIIPRYAIFLMVFMVALTTLAVTISNYEVYNLPEDNPVVSTQYTTEQLIEVGKTQYGSNEKKFNGIYMFFFCVVSFALFVRIEKEWEK